MKKLLTDRQKQNTAVITAIIFMLLSVIFSEDLRISAQKSINDCLNIVIPCIFPVTVISFFIIEVGFPVKLKSITEKLLKKCFGLSGNCSEAVFLGLTGGYNTAVKCAVRLRNENIISTEQAKRLALFFTNPGISFTVLLTGATLSGSLKTGLRLYSETVILNIVFAYIYNRKFTNTESFAVKESNKDTVKSFICAVEAASSVIISVSFSIISFSCITTVIGSILKLPMAEDLLKLTSEVSTAVLYSSSAYPFYVTAGVLTFGGFCIFIQNLADLKRLQIKPSAFLSVRVLQGIIISLAEFIYSVIFPESISVSADFSVKLSSSGSVTGTAALIFLCGVYLISVRSIKRYVILTKKVL